MPSRYQNPRRAAAAQFDFDARRSGKSRGIERHHTVRAIREWPITFAIWQSER
jgi:hypothetical protein